MADISHVTDALGKMIEAALYPDGPPAAFNAKSVAGMPVLIQAGWPDPKSLDRAIAAKEAQVTIYPTPRERNTTRYPRTWEAGPLKPKTFSLALTESSIAVAGAQPDPFYRQNICVFVNRKPYIYSTLANDTPASIAAGLAAILKPDFDALFVAGASVTLPAGNMIGPLRVGSGAPVMRELKRQERDIQITVWAASDQARRDISSPIDTLIGATDWIDLADGTEGRMIYRGSPWTDFDQKQGIFRRDFIVCVEYATTNMDFAPEVVAARTDVQQLAADGTETPIRTLYN